MPDMPPRLVVVGADELRAIIDEAVRNALSATQSAQAADEPRALTIREFSERHHRSGAWARLAISMGLVKAVRHGRRVLVPASEVARIDREGPPSTGTGRRRGPPPKPRLVAGALPALSPEPAP